MCPGTLRHHTKPRCWSVIDVALHPSVIKECEESKESEENIIMLAVKFVEQISDLKLSQSFRYEKEKYQGKYDPAMLTMSLQSHFRVEGDLNAKQHEATLMDELTSIACSNAQDVYSPTESIDPATASKTSKSPLIQEISTNELRLPLPKYSLERKEKNDKFGERFVLKVELQGATSINDIQVEVTKVRSKVTRLNKKQFLLKMGNDMLVCSNPFSFDLNAQSRFYLI